MTAIEHMRLAIRLMEMALGPQKHGNARGKLAAAKGHLILARYAE
jgi:hypothetical protein